MAAGGLLLAADSPANPAGVSGDLAEIPRGFSGDSVGILPPNSLIPLDLAKDYSESPRGRGYLPSRQLAARS